MKKSLLLALCFSLAFGSVALAADKFNLSLTTTYMDKHPTIVEVFLPWAEKIKKETNGAVNIQYFNPGTICPEPEMFSSTVAGVVDMSGNGQSRTAGKFPLASVIDLPIMASSATSGSMLSWEMYQKSPEMMKEMDELKLLWSWASAPFQLHTTNKQVKTLADLKGMKIIAWYPNIMEVLKALGANPIQSSPPDTYLTLQRGGADGVLCPIAPVISFKINEATKYTTVANLFVTNFYFGMNKDVWNALGPENQKVFEANSGLEYAIASGKSLDDGAIIDQQKMIDGGHTFYELPDAELENWKKQIMPLYAKWVKDLEAKKVANPQALLDLTMATSKEIDAKLAK